MNKNITCTRKPEHCALKFDGHVCFEISISNSRLAV